MNDDTSVYGSALKNDLFDLRTNYGQTKNVLIINLPYFSRQWRVKLIGKILWQMRSSSIFQCPFHCQGEGVNWQVKITINVYPNRSAKGLMDIGHCGWLTCQMIISWLPMVFRFLYYIVQGLRTYYECVWKINLIYLKSNILKFFNFK
jgi:hypothetical protein